MRKLISILSLCALATCGSAAELDVVTTTSDLAALTRAVGGDLVSVTSLARGNQDPHYVTPKPSLIVLLRDAELYVKIGLDMEIGYELPLLLESRNAEIQPGAAGHLDASTAVARRLDVPSGPVDRSQGDIHPGGNPHYWLDPHNACLVAEAIASKLAALRPDAADDVKRRSAEFRRRATEACFGNAAVTVLGDRKIWSLQTGGQLQAELNRHGISLGGWAATLAPHCGSKVVTYHKSWSYFLDRFGLSSMGELEPRPGISPTPRHLARLITQAKVEGLGLILSEPYYNQKTTQLIASKTGAPLVVHAGCCGGETDTEDYVDFIDSLVARVAEALKEP